MIKSNTINTTALLLLLVFLSFTTTTQAGNTIVFVNKSAAPGGDGTSWPNAFQHLNDALASTTGGEELWVAAGIYYPDEGANQVNDDPNATFVVSTNINLYGGFDGSEQFRNDRDPSQNFTILSGDIDQNDNTGKSGILNTSFDINGTNAYHLMTWMDTTNTNNLDGFILTGGSASGTNINDERGGVITCLNASLNIENSLIQGNYSKNRAAIWSCESFTVSNSQFIRNRSNDVGAITTSSSSYDQVDFIENNSGIQAALFYTSGSSLSITNSYILGNSTGNSGSVRVQGGDLYMENVIASGNTAGRGGIMALSSNANATLINVTFSGNRANDDGGAIFFSSTGTLDIHNSVIWNNEDVAGLNTFSSSIYTEEAGTINISNSNISGTGGSGSWTPISATDGGGNIDSEPNLVNAPLPTGVPFSNGDFRLTSLSPMFDIGNNSVVTLASDILNQPRVTYGNVDLGAIEGQTQGNVATSLSTPNATIVAGAPLSYTLEVTTPQAIQNHTVYVSNQLSQDLNCIWSAQITGTGSGNLSGSGEINEIYVLNIGSSVTFDIACESATASGTLSHQAQAVIVNGSEFDLSDNIDSVDVSIIPHPTDLSVHHTVDPDLTVTGGDHDFELLIQNNTEFAANGAEFSYDYDDSLNCSWFVSYQDGAQGAAFSGNNDIVALPMDLPGNSLAIVYSNCTVNQDANATLSSIATINWPNGDDTNKTNNTATNTANVIVAVDLQTELETTATQPMIGDTIIFEVYVANESSQNMSNVSVETTTPSKLVGCSWQCMLNEGTSCAQGNQTGFLSDVINMPGDSSATYQMVCTLNGENNQGLLSLSASITSDGTFPDPNLFNNTSTIEREVIIFKSGFE